MSITETLTTLAAELHQLGDPAAAATVAEVGRNYETGRADRQAVLDVLDALITAQPVRA